MFSTFLYIMLISPVLNDKINNSKKCKIVTSACILKNNRFHILKPIFVVERTLIQMLSAVKSYVSLVFTIGTYFLKSHN